MRACVAEVCNKRTQDCIKCLQHSASNFAEVHFQLPEWHGDVSTSRWHSRNRIPLASSTKMMAGLASLAISNKLLTLVTIKTLVMLVFVKLATCLLGDHLILWHTCAYEKKESGRLKTTNTLESLHGPKKSPVKLLPMSMQNGLCGRRKKQWSNNPTCFALCRGLVSINLRQVTSFSLSPIHLDTSKAIASNCKNHNLLALSEIWFTRARTQ